MTQQVRNTTQILADLLALPANWDITDPKEIKKDKIDFNGFVSAEGNRFENGNKIVIEISNPAGTADPRTIALTNIDDLFKLDVWIKYDDASREARIRMHNNRALIKDKILEIIHDNQTAITGLEIATFGKFQELDEPENNILHSIIFVVGQWHHRQS